MANTKSAAKRARQIARRTIANSRVLSAVKTHLKNVRLALKGNNKETAKIAAQRFISAIDKAAKGGRLHRNVANRHKSAVNRALARLS